MSRLVVHNTRQKKVWQVSLQEFKEGKWLQEVPDSDLVEVNWKNGFLTIADAQIRRIETGEKPKKEEEKNESGEE